MKKMILYLVLLSIAFLAFGCNTSTNPTSGLTGGDKYFPLKVGNVWTYQANDGRIQTYSITGTTTVSGKTCYIERMEEIATSSLESLVYNDDNGCWQYGTPSSPLTTPLLILPYPLSIGKRWTINSGATVECECVAVEDVKLTNGVTYANCYRIRYYILSTFINEQWIKEDIGWVKLSNAPTSYWELIGVDLK